jgi:protein transport protein SEC24
MNTNYFSSNKPYPEPKIIEYDLEETSTESSPQHTSSLYSESTDQDSESTHLSNVFTRHMSNKSTECHVTKESKTISTTNQEFPVPSQFADFNLKKSDSIDDHQHSILHSAYNQEDDIIEDIPLFDNIIPNETEPALENQENLESRFNEQSSNMPRAQTFDSYATKKDFEQTNFNYENKQGSSSSAYSSMNNYLSYNVDKSSNAQNSSQFNKGLYFNQANALTQPSLSNSSILQHSQRKPIFPYGNTELFNHHEISSSNQSYKDDFNSDNFNQQNKHIQPNIQKSNVPPVDSSLQYNINSNTQDEIVLENDSIKTSNADALKYQTMNSCATNLYKQNDQGMESISQQSMYNSSKPPVSELLNNSQQTASKEFIPHNSSLISTQSLGPVTSATIVAPLSSFSVSEAEFQNKQNTQYQKSDDQASNLLNLSNNAKNSPIDLLNQDSTNIQSEIDTKLSKSPISNILENQQETTVDQTEPINKQFNKNQHDEIKSMSPPSIKNVTQSNDFFNQKSMTSQLESKNHFTPQQPIVDNIKTSYDQFSNKPINVESQPINNQNVTVQQSVPTTGHSVSHYFDSSNVNNKFVFNQQSCNLQPSGQLQNMQIQDKPTVSINPTPDKSNNCTEFSYAQDTSIKSSSNQQPLLTKNELETVENVKLDSDVSSKETLHSSESLLTQANNLNFKSSENAEIVTPNDQFSKMAIDKQQNISDNKIHIQEQSTPTSYFSKDISLDKEENSIQFKNFSTTFQDNNSSVPKLEVINNSQLLQNKQKNLVSLNSDLPTNHEVSPLSLSNQIIPDNKASQQEANQFPQQHFSNKVTSNEILSSSNQLPPQIYNNQPKLNTIQPLQSGLNPYTTQPFNNQPTLNTVSSASNQLPSKMFDNQPKPDTLQPLQSASNPYTTQQFDNQQTPTTIPSVSNQFPPQMLNNQQTSNSVPPSQFASSSSYPTPIVSTATNLMPTMFSNQPISNTVSPPQFASSSYPTSTALTATNQFPPTLFSNQSTSNNIQPLQSASNLYPTQVFSNQSKPVTVPSSDINQFPPQINDNQSKSMVMPQTAAKMFVNQSTPSTAWPSSSTTNQFQPQIFNGQIKSDVSSIQTLPSQYASQPFNNKTISNMIPPVPSATSQLPSKILSNQPKSNVGLIQSTTGQYPFQPFNNQHAPTTVSSAINPLPTQLFSNQPKSNVVTPLQTTSNQYNLQAYNNQQASNFIPSVSSTTNQFPSQILTNQPKLDGSLSNQLIASQYQSQPLINQSSMGAPPIQQATNQYPSQPFSHQSKPSNFPTSQTVKNQYPSQPFTKQPGQQVLPKQNLQQYSSNQFGNQPNSIQQVQNQWPPANFSSQTTNLISSQPITMNSSNLSTVPPNVNQQSQMLGTHMLPQNPLSSNNFYNQVEGIGNVQQPQSSNHNVQLASKGYPPQNNMGFSSQTNYQQPNALHRQQGFHNQQQDQYRPEQNPSVVQQGFSKTWVSFFMCI